jgi:hypothetical protein
MSALGLVSRVLPVHTAVRNCTRDEGGPFGFGNQVLISSHRKLLRSKAVVVSVAETPGARSREASASEPLQALVRNVRTYTAMPREKAQAASAARPKKVPMRRLGADCSAVVRKRGNARGAQVRRSTTKQRHLWNKKRQMTDNPNIAMTGVALYSD